jgi:hypothetical protein
MIAHFDARLPIEAISELGARSEPLRVSLVWRPSLLQNVWFRSALVIVLVGLMLMSLASLTAHVRTRRNRRAAFQGPFKTRQEAEECWRQVSEENRHKADVRFSIVEEGEAYEAAANRPRALRNG